MSENIREVANSLALITSEAATLKEMMDKADAGDASASMAFEDTMESLNLMIEDKADVVAEISDEILNDIKTAKAHIEYYQDIKRSCENKQRYFYDRIMYAMDQSGISKISTEHQRKIYISSNGGLQPLEISEDELDEEYFKCIKVPDKEKIRKALEEGREIKGAKLLPRDRHLVIK